MNEPKVVHRKAECGCAIQVRHDPKAPAYQQVTTCDEHAGISMKATNGRLEAVAKLLETENGLHPST